MAAGTPYGEEMSRMRGTQGVEESPEGEATAKARHDQRQVFVLASYLVASRQVGQDVVVHLPMRELVLNNQCLIEVYSWG